MDPSKAIGAMLTRISGRTAPQPQPTAMLTDGSGRSTTGPETAMLTHGSGRSPDIDRMTMTLMAHRDQGRVGPPAPIHEPTRMIRHDSGRTAPTSTRLPEKITTDKHPGVNCDGCNKPVGDKVRFKCLDCADFDLCATCEGSNAIANHHFDGKHLFAKIRDSTAIGGNDVVNAYKKH